MTGLVVPWALVAAWAALGAAGAARATALAAARRRARRSDLYGRHPLARVQPGLTAWVARFGVAGFVAQRRRRRARAASHDQLADVVDLFALAVGAGCNLRLALDAVASRAPPEWVAPLAEVLARIGSGAAAADALEALLASTGEHARPLVTLLVTSERYGTALLPALERLAADERLERRRRAEERARRVPVKLLFPLVLCVLPAFGALTVVPLLAGALGSLRL